MKLPVTGQFKPAQIDGHAAREQLDCGISIQADWIKVVPQQTTH
ncbi:MAG: hypothetical protein WDM87_00365 [Terracidiphilus sp.]